VACQPTKAPGGICYRTLGRFVLHTRPALCWWRPR
jgi:hypothetical protein